jgi:hypothetical protein
MTRRIAKRRRDEADWRVNSTARAAAALFGGVTGGVAGVYLLTFSVLVTALAATVGAVIVVLVLHAGR